MWKFPRSLFMTLLLIYHRGIQGYQYLSTEFGTTSSVQLHPYSVLCIAGGFHVAKDSPYSQPRLLWLCKHALKNCRKWTERYRVVEKSIAFCLIGHLLFQQSSSFVDDSLHHFQKRRVGKRGRAGQRQESAEGCVHTTYESWYRKSLLAEHGDWWNINCTT